MEIISNGVVLGIIIGLVEVVKRIGLPKRFLPLLSVLLGLGLVCLTGIPLGQVVIAGLALGLSACGLFSGIKATLGK